MRKKKNIVLEDVLVENYAAEGKSLARTNGKVVFIEGAVPGDVVDVRLSKNKKDWAEGYPINFRSYSAERVLPFCQHFGVCGGCQWQMLPYHKQLQYKHQQVFDNLSRIGKINLPDFLPIIGAEDDKYYRNKLEYTFSTKEFTKEKPERQTIAPSGSRGGGKAPSDLPGGGEIQSQSQLNHFANKNFVTQKSEDSVQVAFPTGEGRDGAGEVSASMAFPFGEGRDEVISPGALGFHARGFFDKIVHIEKCWLQAEPTNEIRNAVRLFAQTKGYSFYNYREHRGLLRNLIMRICTTGEVMVNVVFGEDDKEKREEFLLFIFQNFPQITTLLYTVNLKWNDSLYDQVPVTFSGNGFVIEKLEDFQFKIGPKSFFQTNTKQAEKLYQVTREFAELDGSQTLYDLYCGTGSIGIFCSRGAKKIIGVEAIQEAVTDAKQNALLNNIQHAEFVCGDVINVCNDGFFQEHGFPDVIITDPPRAGMHAKLVEKILEMEAPLVVYVSCNPATQARDLSLLDMKYTVTKIQPVDMFLTPTILKT